MTFDTLAAAKLIEAAGLDRVTAEAVVAEIAATRVELFSKADGAALQANLATAIADSTSNTIKWMVGMMVVIVGFADAILLFALRR